MQLLEIGPSYGSLAEPSKSIILVKEQHLQDAKPIFCDLQVEVVLGGHFLGGCVSDEVGVRQYVSGKIDMWVRCIELLAGAARSHPQSPYAALTHSLSCEWSYLQRFVKGCRLRDTVHQVFPPAMLGRVVLNVEHSLLALPAELGGLAHDDPVKSDSFSFSTSEAAASVLQEAVETGNEIAMADSVAHCQALKREGVKQKEEAQQ